MNGQEPAFPAHEGIISIGITIRDYFAAKAMQGFMNSKAFNPESEHKVAQLSYKLADAMILERIKSNG